MLLGYNVSWKMWNEFHFFSYLPFYLPLCRMILWLDRGDRGAHPGEPISSWVRDRTATYVQADSCLKQVVYIALSIVFVFFHLSTYLPMSMLFVSAGGPMAFYCGRFSQSVCVSCPRLTFVIYLLYFSLPS